MNDCGPIIPVLLCEKLSSQRPVHDWGCSLQRRVTIDEIARQSQASRTTVSLVLRDKPGIGAETRQRVWAAAQALGYQRRFPAPVEPGRGILNIGLIVRSRNRNQTGTLPLVNPFYSWVLAGVEAGARSQQMNLLYATLPVDHDNAPLDIPENLLSQRLDGVLLVGSFSKETIDEVAGRAERAIVLIDVPLGPHAHDAVVSDNFAGAHAATSYLIAKGHRRIAFIRPGPELNPNFCQRREGYLKALHDHDLAPIPEPKSDQDVASATEALFRRYPDVSAIVGCNDPYSIDAMRAVQSMGRRVPDDLSCIGFDDIELAAHTSPPLTTMAVDKVSMGRLAVQALSYRIAWPDAATVLTVLRPELIERGSVCAITSTTKSA
jgi:DNA-binding LacI/PurR family transcriptional regulator